jgi:uncharacterized protein DUF4352
MPYGPGSSPVNIVEDSSPGGERRHTMSNVNAPQQPYPSYSPEPPKKKHTVRNVLLGTVGVVLVLGVITSVVGGGDPTTPAADGASGQSRSAARQKPDGKTAKPKKRAAGLGDPVRDGKFQFTVTKIGHTSAVGTSYLGKKAQGEFVVVNVTVKNIGDEARALSADNQTLFDADGRKFTADSEAAIYVDESNSLYEDVNPGNSLKGKLLFDVPRKAELDHLELHDSMFSGGVDVSLNR